MTVWMRDDVTEVLMKARRSKAPVLGDDMPDSLVAFRRMMEDAGDEPFCKDYAADDADALSIEDTAPKHPPIICPTCGKVAAPKALKRHMQRTGHGERKESKRVPNENVVANPDGDFDAEMNLSKALVKPEMRFTLAPLYRPGVLDAHGDWTDADELQKSLHDYIRKGYRKLHKQHGGEVIGEVLEAFQWPYDHEADLRQPDGSLKKMKLPAGTVYCGVKWTPAAWQDVKRGRINGLSMGGTTMKVKGELPS
jgi:Putative phage serine protease XkdF